MPAANGLNDFRLAGHFSRVGFTNFNGGGGAAYQYQYHDEKDEETGTKRMLKGKYFDGDWLDLKLTVHM